MVVKTGTDIVHIPRIQALLDKYNQKFIQRILNNQEIQDIKNLKPNKIANHLAKRFAAKEAIVKALGTGIGNQNISFHDITIINDNLGKPMVLLSDKINNLFQHFGQNKTYDLSIADDKDFAISIFILIIL